MTDKPVIKNPPSPTGGTSELPTEEILALINSSKGLSIASIDDKNSPLSSYAPYYQEQGKFYLLLSGLAEHCSNIARQKKASLMIMENENQVANIFARKRLSVICECDEIARMAPVWQDLIKAMEVHLGPTVGVLQGLPDFKLFELTVQAGNYVKGFGAAFPISSEEWQSLFI